MNQPPYGPPGVAPGYAPPPQQYGASPPQQYGASPPQQYGAHAPPPATPKGFVSGLFDLSFTTFVTTRVLKVLYVFFLIAVALSLLVSVGAGLMAIVAGGAGESGAAMFMGFVQLIIAPFVCLFALIYGRIVFECIAVFFRVAEHLSEINRKTKE